MQRSKLSLIIGLNLLILVLALWLKPRFQTNDDIAMIYAYSGTTIFDEPTTVTAFSTKIWGLFMVLMYKMVPAGIEIYTIVFLVMIFILNIIIHWKLFESVKRKNPYYQIILAPVLIFIALNFYLELQFTMLSGLLCFSGLLLLLYQPSKRDKWTGYFLVMVACILRLDVFPVVFSFFILLGLFATFSLPDLIDSRKTILKRWGFVILIFVAVYSIDQNIHNKAERQYLEFNSFRSSIVDYSADESNPSILPSEWGNEELGLFKNWFYSDDKLYNSQRSYKITGSTYQSGFIEKIRQKDLWVPVNVEQFCNPYFSSLLILSVFPIFWLQKWKSGLIFMAVVVLLYLVFYHLMTIFLKEPPFRVSFMLFSSGILMYIYFAAKMMEVYQPITVVKIIVSSLLFFFVLRTTIFNLSARSKTIMESICKENYHKNLIYIHSPYYPFELVDPFNVSELGRHTNRIWLCSFSAHPTIRRSFEELHFDNLTFDIIGQEDKVSFIMPEDRQKWEDFNSAYTEFIAKTYHRQVGFEKVNDEEHCYGFSEYKLREIFNVKPAKILN